MRKMLQRTMSSSKVSLTVTSRTIKRSVTRISTEAEMAKVIPSRLPYSMVAIRTAIR